MRVAFKFLSFILKNFSEYRNICVLLVIMVEREKRALKVNLKINDYKYYSEIFM